MLYNIDSFGGDPIGETIGKVCFDFCGLFSEFELDWEPVSGNGLLMREDVGIISQSAVASS